VDISLSPVEIAGRTLALAIGRDITKERRAQQAIYQARQYTDNLIETANALIVGLDSEGAVEVFSPSAERLTGYTKAELVGQNWFDILVPRDRYPHVWKEFQRLQEGGVPEVFENPILTKDGQERVIAWRNSVMTRDGQAVGTISFGIDITDHMRAERELREALAEITVLKEQLAADNLLLREEVRRTTSYVGIVGQSAGIRAVLEQVEQVAGTDTAVLLLGETGTGKELIARAIHARSERSQRPMVSWNCAAIPASLAESELFGREKGAYTGALSQQAGRFEVADGSSIFLDEVGELSLEIQGKLLRVLEEGEFERLGSSKTRTADVRVIAATNRNLEAEVERGRFRQDLYFRLNVFPITLPPLRDRTDDIPALVRQFVREIGARMGKTFEEIHGPSLAALQRRPWPGNVRELRNVVERAMILGKGPVLKIAALETDEPVQDAPDRLEEVQRRHIRGILQRTGWKVRGPGGAAAILGLKPTTLESRMRKLGIRRPDSPPDIS
jgi:PAS domain S-box-containing protein